MVHWTIEPVRFSTDLAESAQAEVSNHARLTDNGRRKIEVALKAHGKPDLEAGVDYRVKEVQPNANWFPFEENTYTSDYCHNWVLVRRNRPHDPTFLHCPMPRRGDGEHERNAALIMTYFHPFTLNPGWHEEHVPFLGRMCGQLDSWHMSMLQWFDGRILSEESRRYI